MKKTLLVTLDFPPCIGGVSTYYHQLIKRLPADKVIVLVHSNNNESSFDNTQKYKIIRKNFYAFPIFPRWIFLLKEIFQIIKKEKIEFIQVGQVLPIGTVAYILNKFLGINYSVYTHGMDITLPMKIKRKRFLLKQILKNAKFISTVSNYTKKRLMELGVDENKIIFLYPSIDIKEFNFTKNKDNKSLKNDIILITIARLVERKGHDMVLKALKLIDVNQRLDFNIIYRIVGNGVCYTKLKEQVELLDFSDKITIEFCGLLSELAKKQALQTSDIFIMPSRELSNGDVEGFGLVYLEANYYGKPVIAGNSGGVPDAVSDGINGFLVNPLDANDIALKILLLAQDKELAKKLGQQGYDRIKNKFQWDMQVSKLKEQLQ